MATVDVLAIGTSIYQQRKHIATQVRVITLIGAKSRRLGRVPRLEDSRENEDLFKRGRAFLQWLDTIDITPEIKEKTVVPDMLKLLIDRPEFFYPEDMKEIARALRDRWESENWGANAVDDEGEPPESPESASSEAPVVEASLPPPNHPIYGEHGIMHGIIILRSPTGRKTYRLNPRIPKKSAKVYGHNGIPLGAWFANQLVALHRGAHGSRMGGISGNTETGAYSIVVANIYHDLDDDRGETLYYSGSNSHDNDDPLRPAPSSAGTNALRASMQTGIPVRVLRSGGSNSSEGNRWLPDCGLRYDGLYRVVALRHRTNTKGGLYEQFELRREPGQTPLEELCISSPTRQQKRDLDQIQRGY